MQEGLPGSFDWLLGYLATIGTVWIVATNKLLTLRAYFKRRG